MQVVEKIISEESYRIKSIVNEISNKYDNFNHFVINYSNTKSNEIKLYLFFNESYSLKNNEKICVEYLKDVYYEDVGEVIKNCSVDFDGYVSCDIIGNTDKENLLDIVLTYKVKDFNGDLNFKYIRKISGGGYKGNIYQRAENFEIYNYLGNDYRSEYNVDWNLMFKYARDHIMVSKDYYAGKEESLFQLSVGKGDKIKITKFVNGNEIFYDSTVSQFEYKEINVDDIMIFVIDLINVIEDELKIKISKPTFKYIEEKLMKVFKDIIK